MPRNYAVDQYQKDDCIRYLKALSYQARYKVDGRTEARLMEIASGPAPEGHSRWTIRLLEDEMKVTLEEPLAGKRSGVL